MTTRTPITRTGTTGFAADNRLLRSDGTGRDAQGTGITCDDSDNLTGVASLTATTITPTTIELGHASDTTLARDSAGVVSIETVPIVTTTASQTLTNKTLTSPVLTTPQINDTSSDHQYIFGVSELSADRTVTLPLLTGNDTFVFAGFAQTITNKSIDLTDNTITGSVTEFNTALESATFGTFASAQTDHGIVRADGTEGLLQTSGVTISDTNAVSGITTLTTGPVIGTVQDLNGAGAVNVTTYITKWGTTGADAGTLADGVEGQIKMIIMDARVGDGTLTPTNLMNSTTITFTAVGAWVQLVFIGTEWVITGGAGVVVA